MSREGSHEHATVEQAEVLEVIREECSPAISSVNMNTPKAPGKEEHKELCTTDCACLEHNEMLKSNLKPQEVEKLLIQKEDKLTAEFQERLEKEISLLKDRADFILQNEQVRSSYMLQEAHRERQEKISALQTQLECKNLAGLMYVMCTERRKSQLEKLRIIEEYSNYIIALQQILTEAQELILNLSRGYKTAARVDKEWRGKMTKVLTEFQMFVHDFNNGTPETNQFYFDLPTLLKTHAPIVDDPDEDPCEKVEEEECFTEEDENEKPWYERLDDYGRPFVMFGDMSEFKPTRRREVLRTQKEAKTAPKKWNEYVFNDMYVKKHCANADTIKDDYPNRLPAPMRWECEHARPAPDPTRGSVGSRRNTAVSVDLRNTMGSILKMITTANIKPQGKAMLLGARDSMEIASTTKLREKHKHQDRSKVEQINVGVRRTSFYESSLDEVPKATLEPEKSVSQPEAKPSLLQDNDDEGDESLLSALGSIHNDSLTVLPTRTPAADCKIHYEKVCPMDKCQRMQVDSFVRSLPLYMQASPFTHFEQTYEEYETCSPEQLAILRERIESKKKKGKETEKPDKDPLEEWTTSGVQGVAVQTSDMSLMSLPPCSCRAPSPSLSASAGKIFNLDDLIPMKQALNRINKECFYDSTIEFDRFKVIGQESKSSIREAEMYRTNKLQDITRILKQHPSLLDIFQSNAV